MHRVMESEHPNRPAAALRRVCLALCTAAALTVSSSALAQQQSPPAGIRQQGSPQQLTLNFSDTDIGAVINAVAEITGKNFIVDPRVKGKVTVISSRPLDKDALYEVFLSVLKVHGFAAIPTENAVKIVPDVHAKQDAVPTVTAKTKEPEDAFVTSVIPVENVDAAQLVPILRPLVPQRGHLAAYPPSNVLIISDSAGNVERLRKIIQRIDTTVNEGMEVIPLQHASAAEVVRILNELAAQGPKSKGAQAPFDAVADERTNSILLSGEKNARVRVRAIISTLDTPVEAGGATQVVYLRYANAKDLVPVLSGISENIGAKATPGGKAAATGAKSDKISIQADESTNALVINAPPDVFRSLRSVISRLDVRRAQVLVEAVIAEVSSQKSAELGVQWVADGRSGNNAIGLINFSTGTAITGLLTNPPTVGDGLNLGIGDFSKNSLKWGAFVRALASDSHTNILSTPSLVTMDNEEAEIVVGQNVPFVTGSFSTTGTGAIPTNPFQTIQRQDVGITLKIKPQINEGNAVRLEIQQESSSVSNSAQAVDLITNKRSIKTNVMIDDGQVLVLGGLIEDRLRETEQKVPGLGDVPLLGWLFKYKQNVKEKTNLMVFIRPVILKDEGLQARYTGEKYNFIRAQELAARDRGMTLMADEEAPLLPELGEFMQLPPPYDETLAPSAGAAPRLPPAVTQGAPLPDGH